MSVDPLAQVISGDGFVCAQEWENVVERVWREVADTGRVDTDACVGVDVNVGHE